MIMNYLLTNHAYQSLRKKIQGGDLNYNEIFVIKIQGGQSINEFIFEISLEELIVSAYHNGDSIISYRLADVIAQLKDVYEDDFIQNLDVESITKYFKNTLKNKELLLNKYYKDCARTALFFVVVRYIYSCVNYDRDEYVNSSYLDELVLNIYTEDNVLLNYFKNSVGRI